MSDPRRFDFRELAGADDAGGDAELGEALVAARTLESALAGPDARPSPDLPDRIMAAVALVPAPRPIGILASLRRRPGLRGLVDSLQVAWPRVLASGRPLGLRAGALAYVAVVVVLAASLTGVAAYTTAGAFGLLGSTASQAPFSTPGLPTPGRLASPAPTETESAEPSETPEPTGVVEPSDVHGGTSQEPGDGRGWSATSAPISGEDGGADGGSVSQTAEPSPTATPQRTESPKPTSTSSSSNG